MFGTDDSYRLCAPSASPPLQGLLFSRGIFTALKLCPQSKEPKRLYRRAWTSWSCTWPAQILYVIGVIVISTLPTERVVSMTRRGDLRPFNLKLAKSKSMMSTEPVIICHTPVGIEPHLANVKRFHNLNNIFLRAPGSAGSLFTEIGLSNGRGISTSLEDAGGNVRSVSLVAGRFNPFFEAGGSILQNAGEPVASFNRLRAALSYITRRTHLGPYPQRHRAAENILDFSVGKIDNDRASDIARASGRHFVSLLISRRQLVDVICVACAFSCSVGGLWLIVFVDDRRSRKAFIAAGLLLMTVGQLFAWCGYRALFVSG